MGLTRPELLPYSIDLMYAVKPYRDCVALQNLVMAAAKDSETSPRDLSSLARAYTELQECKRKIKGVPLTAPIDWKELKALRAKVLEIGGGRKELSTEEPGEVEAEVSVEDTGPALEPQ
jgi:hypothetical protein